MANKILVADIGANATLANVTIAIRNGQAIVNITLPPLVLLVGADMFSSVKPAAIYADGIQLPLFDPHVHNYTKGTWEYYANNNTLEFQADPSIITIVYNVPVSQTTTVITVNGNTTLTLTSGCDAICATDNTVLTATALLIIGIVIIIMLVLLNPIQAMLRKGHSGKGV
jgi:hypothetical protein